MGGCFNSAALARRVRISPGEIITICNLLPVVVVFLQMLRSPIVEVEDHERVVLEGGLEGSWVRGVKKTFSYKVNILPPTLGSVLLPKSPLLEYKRSGGALPRPA